MVLKHYYPTAVSDPMEDFVVSDDYNQDPEGRIEDAVSSILYSIGEDASREGLHKTPDRVARMYAEITAGYQIDPEKMINGALFDVDYDEMVVVKDIEFYSMCEHHMLPFFGHAHVAYIPGRQGDRAEQDPAHRGNVCPPPAGAGAHDRGDCRLSADTLHPRGWR